MANQSQNPKFRNNAESFHPFSVLNLKRALLFITLIMKVSIKKDKKCLHLVS